MSVSQIKELYSGWNRVDETLADRDRRSAACRRAAIREIGWDPEGPEKYAARTGEILMWISEREIKNA